MTPEELRAIRERLGLLQKELGAAIGVSATSIYRMESGRQTITDRTAKQVRELEEKLRRSA